MYKEYVKELVDNEELPGGVLYVQHKKKTHCFEAFGSFADNWHEKQKIRRHTLFDMASLTKVVATLPAFLYLLSKKELRLEGRVQEYLPHFRFPEVTLEHLLTHTSGLPADLSYQERFNRRDVVAEIYQEDLLYVSGSKAVYSDLGMILLGQLIEKAAGQPLNRFVEERIFDPWGMKNTSFGLPENSRALAASTEEYKGSYIQGEVHDEKAFQLDGVSGSAGLFSTAGDIAKYAHFLLYPEEQHVIPAHYLHMATQHRGFNRGLGFEVWSGNGNVLSCGEKWPSGSFGHTGFTGTSLWVNPLEELIVVFLTNAVHFGRDTKIKSIRQTLHSLIYSSISGGINK